ncbi:MAG: SusC/RagA family TonB-linked outer membrane protein, partial [Bacteroidetes bacterium]|nr:SusC/RagA family TonB-linked outer membrane protein [Bacteroidota bacterium]
MFDNNLIVVALKQPVQNHKVTGTVTDAATGEPLPGVSILVKGTTLGTSTDVNGVYVIQIPDVNSVLTFSFVGYLTEDIAVEGRQLINLSLSPDIKQLEEIVVVGYGEQKKESVVGAIAQTGSKELLRSGATDVGQALTGLLPGVVTIQSSGMPGENDPKIFIRGLSTWNGGQPLVLVDGVERSMNDLNINEIESISVLKDASATAVFGVKGAEGVILIKTKRGQVGKSKLEFSYKSSFKFNSRLPEKLNSYESLLFRNNAIENELSITEQEWNRYVPMQQLLRYKRSNQEPGDEYIFPDVNWTDELLGDYGLDHQANININGGSEFLKYNGFLGYLHEGDILEGVQANNTPYSPGYSYNRLNFRTNIDLNITKSTTISVNLSGNYGIQKKSYANDNDVWQAIYETAPFAFPVTHPNEPGWAGTIWGYNIDDVTVKNPIKLMSNSGVNNLNTSQINTDFILLQKLDKITKGLSLTGRVS